MRAEKKAAKAAESVNKSEKKKAAALAAAKTEVPGSKAPPKVADDADTATDSKDDSQNTDVAADRPAGETPIDQVANSDDIRKGAPATAGSPTLEGTDELIVPLAGGKRSETTELNPSDEKADEVPTTEAGKKAAEAKPKARRSLLGREEPADDSPEKET